jgi:hypothetical protein
MCNQSSETKPQHQIEIDSSFNLILYRSVAKGKGIPCLRYRNQAQ